MDSDSDVAETEKLNSVVSEEQLSKAPETQKLNSAVPVEQLSDVAETEKLNSAVSVEQPSNKASEGSKKWWHIDKDMVGFKLHYFLLTGALGSVLPFIAVIAKDRLKLSATSFATVLMIEQFLFVFTKPVIGYVTDYFNKLKAVLCIVAIGQGIFLFLLLLLPEIPQGPMRNDNGAFSNLSSFDTPDYCKLCNTSLDLKQASKISLNYSHSGWKDPHQHHLSLSEVKECNFFRNQSHYSQHYIIVPPECHNNIDDSSSRLNDTILEHRTNGMEKRSTMNSNGGHFGALICPQAIEDSCVIFINSCVICCNHEADCYYISDRLSTQSHQDRISDFQTYQFWMFVLVFIILNACINAIFTLSDTACCESVQKYGADYGKQRLWGAVGWGLFAPLGGFLSDYTGDYVVTWIVFAVMSTFMLWNISKLDLVKPHFSKHILKDIGTVMKSSEFLCFEVGVLVNGIGLGFIWFYLMWFVISIGGSRLICGLAQCVQCFVGELPFMFFSGWLLRKMGYFNILTLSLLAYCTRFLWYSRLEDPWLVLPIEWTHGITYGVFYTSLAAYAKMSARPGTETTTQAVVFATYDGLGAGIGNIIAGLGFDYVGGEQTFFYTSIFFGCSSVVSICYTLFLRNMKKAEAAKRTQESEDTSQF